MAIANYARHPVRFITVLLAIASSPHMAASRNDIVYYFSRVKQHDYCVYIITNKNNTVLYIGVTSDLQGRIWQHKNKAFKGFSATYDCNKLVYYEEFQWIQDAIAREKQLKAGSRQKKVDLIESNNPSWIDLSKDWYD